MAQYDHYTTIRRNGVECQVYDWGKYTTKESFEEMLDNWGGQKQHFFYNSCTKEWFLIDKQERVVINIKSKEVITFLTENVYAADINETFIELFEDKKTKEQLKKELKEYIENFGENKIVYAWFQQEEGKVLVEFSLMCIGKCTEPEKLGRLFELVQ